MVSQIKLGDIAVDVVLKDIKNVYLSVYPPTGRVRITAPKHMNLDTVRVFAISKLAWIQKQQQKHREQERETFGNISTGKVTMPGGNTIYSGLWKWMQRRRWN